MNDDHLFQKLTAEPDVLSVSQLNARARQLLEDVFPRIWVEGELSNLSRPSSGHMYFTLKDDRAQIRCALFRQHAARVRLAMRDGQQIRARGRVSLYEGRGDYQLIVDSVETAGDGALHTLTVRRVLTNRKSSTSLPSLDTAWARTPAG